PDRSRGRACRPWRQPWRSRPAASATVRRPPSPWRSLRPDGPSHPWAADRARDRRTPARCSRVQGTCRWSWPLQAIRRPAHPSSIQLRKNFKNRSQVPDLYQGYAVTPVPLQAAVQLEGQQDLRYGGGGHLASAYQFVNRSGYGAELGHDRFSGPVMRDLFRFFSRLADGLRLPEHTYNIVGIASQNGPIPDQGIRSGIPLVHWRSRDDEHLAPLLKGPLGGDQGAGALGRFDDDHPGREPADDAVAAREGAGDRRHAERRLGQQ